MHNQQSKVVLAIASVCMLSGGCMPQVVAQPSESLQSLNPLVSAAITNRSYQHLICAGNLIGTHEGADQQLLVLRCLTIELREPRSPP